MVQREATTYIDLVIVFVQQVWTNRGRVLIPISLFMAGINLPSRSGPAFLPRAMGKEGKRCCRPRSEHGARPQQEGGHQTLETRSLSRSHSLRNILVSIIDLFIEIYLILLSFERVIYSYKAKISSQIYSIDFNYIYLLYWHIYFPLYQLGIYILKNTKANCYHVDLKINLPSD